MSLSYLHKSGQKRVKSLVIMHLYQPPPAYHALYQNNSPHQPTQDMHPSNRHLCKRTPINCGPHCVKCNKSQADRGMLDLDPNGPGRHPHRQINVVTILSPRSQSGRVPRELHGRLHHFDFTVQLSLTPQDPNTWLFNDSQLMAIISPIVNGTARIEKSFPDPGINSTLQMTRVNIPGPSYVVEYMMQSADQYDIGLWGWYRYTNGSVRVRARSTYILISHRSIHSSTHSPSSRQKKGLALAHKRPELPPLPCGMEEPQQLALVLRQSCQPNAEEQV
ncbi:hypothetical protein B0H12DRAFT_1114463 [Mycena haematopus]|nr:hypothetical protein B0H12DRAFT_1114463 [Mycena haematopus]